MLIFAGIIISSISIGYMTSVPVGFFVLGVSIICLGFFDAIMNNSSKKD